MEVVFVTDKSFYEQAVGLMKLAPVKVRVEVIPAGKLRRYHNVSPHRQIFDVVTMGRNLVDVFKIGRGYFRSLRLIKKYRPDVVFAKGGYVCLPLGYATRRLKIPLVIHDSDVRPGLTNRLLARFASRIATGSPLENYPYDKSISRYTGVPIAEEYRVFSDDERRQFRSELGIPEQGSLVVVTGGGLGARSINRAVRDDIDELMKAGLVVYHVCGKNNYEELKATVKQNDNYFLVPFVYKDMYKLLGAADIVVSRGSATFLQELAALKKPVVVVPGKHLGDQVKNASMYLEAGAVAVLTDDEIAQTGILSGVILELVNNSEHAEAMAMNLHSFARPQAAYDTAQLIRQAYEEARGAQ